MASRRGSGSSKSSSRGGKRPLQTGVTRSGYQTFKDPSTGNWELTHRRVAEKMVGGPIGVGRGVHHIDGDKNNNRRSNLRILSKEAHHEIHRNKK
jgi:hypothetical protein